MLNSKISADQASQLPRFIIRLTAILFSIFTEIGYADSIFNAADIVVNYDPYSPPPIPKFGEASKWVRTKILPFDTDDYKPYFYKGIAFRLKFPSNFDRKKGAERVFPMLIVLPGHGERGSIYDNESQLRHGAQEIGRLVDSGEFDGFILIPQLSSLSAVFQPIHGEIILDLLHTRLIPELHLDRDRILLHGLSTGGQLAWQMLERYPLDFSGLVSISHVYRPSLKEKFFNSVRYSPIAIFQGRFAQEQETGELRLLSHYYKDRGAALTYTEFPNDGHRCWFSAWKSKTFVEFLKSSHRANPTVIQGNSRHCSDTPREVLIAVTPGSDYYEWRVNGKIIPNENKNVLAVGAFGTYETRVSRSGTWSRKPLVIEKSCAPLAIAKSGETFDSSLLPGINGKNLIPLSAPSGWASYQWLKNEKAIEGANSPTFFVSEPGNYSVVSKRYSDSPFSHSNTIMVTESSSAHNSLLPDDISAVPSAKGVTLTWRKKGAPASQAQLLEIYRASYDPTEFTPISAISIQSRTYRDRALPDSGPFVYRIECTLRDGSVGALTPHAKRNGSDWHISWNEKVFSSTPRSCTLLRSATQKSKYFILSIEPVSKGTYHDKFAAPSRLYSYVVRAYEEDRAAPVSDEEIVQTFPDTKAPSPPLSVVAIDRTHNAAQLHWRPSVDNDQVRAYSVESPTLRIDNTGNPFESFPLALGRSRTSVTVRAQDRSGNISIKSKPVPLDALTPKFAYYFFGDLESLNYPLHKAEFAASASGPAAEISLDSRMRDERFAYMWRGAVTPPRPGKYEFRITTNGAARIYTGDELQRMAQLPGLEAIPTGNHIENHEFNDAINEFMLIFYSRGTNNHLSVELRDLQDSDFKPLRSAD